MSYCSRSRRCRFTVLDFKSWAYSLIYGHFQQHLYCACAETVIYELPPFDSPPRFPVRVQNFGDLATFSVDYCILYSECPPYFYFRFLSPTDLESIPHASTHTLIIPTKFEVGMWIPCRVIAFFVGWYVTWPCDLWPLDLEQFQCMAGHVTNLATKLEDPMPIRSWFMRYNVSH